jgi:hypothetical protein
VIPLPIIPQITSRRLVDGRGIVWFRSAVTDGGFQPVYLLGLSTGAHNRAIISYACTRPPTENHPWRNARLWRARSADVLLGLQVQSFDRDQRRPMAR